MNSILEIDHLKKSYHDLNGEIVAVKDVSFQVKDKEFVAIVGPSGCGKSTILSILSELEEKSGGTIRFLKPSIKVGYMLQRDSLFPWRTILENCLIGLEINHDVTVENVEYVKHLLTTYGLGDFMDKYPDSLSGGMRQRVL